MAAMKICHTGIIKSDTLIVTVQSNYEFGEPGVAKLTFIGKDSLFFEFITPPGGEYWIPDDAILTRSK